MARSAADGSDPAPVLRAFVGRERQLETMVTALDDAIAGRGRLLLAGGEPGIGKTRLAEEFASQAVNRGARVLWGRCWEAGGAPAYWPWIQLLRSLVVDASPDELERLLGESGPDLVQILPELRDRMPRLAGPSPASPESARFELFVAVSRLLARASHDQPLVLALEDLHAADASSLLLLRFVAAGINEQRVVLLGTYRDNELQRLDPLTTTIPELLRAPGAARITLPGLTARDVGRLVATITRVEPSAVVAATIYDRTEGNPLFVEEFIRLAELDELALDVVDRPWPVPEGIRDVIGRRLDRLTPECRSMLGIASVVGREFQLSTLETVCGSTEETVLEILQDAIAARLVGESHDGPAMLRFAHSLVRDTAYEELAPAERHRLHRRVAEALEAEYRSSAEPFLAELAHHYSAAGRLGDPDKTIEYATAAGMHAVRALAYEEAVRLFEMALRPLEESPDERRLCEVLVLLGDAQARAGDQTRSKDTFLGAASIAARIDDAVLLARSALGYAGRFPFARAGADTRLVPLLQQALDAFPDTDDVLRARLLARLAGALRDQPSTERRGELGTQAVEMARRLGDPETLTYALLGWWSAALLGPDEVDRQLRVATELDDLAQSIGDKELRTDAVWARFIASLTRGDIWEARRQHQLQAQRSDELQQAPQRWYAGVIATVLALQDGHFDDAERLIGETVAVGRQAQAWDAEASRLFALFVLRREQGRLSELEDDLRRALATHPGYRSMRCMLLTALLDSGRDDEARGLIKQLSAEQFGRFPKDNEWLFSMTLLADAAAALGDEGAARILYSQLEPYGNLVALAGSEVSFGPVARPLGVLATVLRRYDEAASHFEDAIAMCDQMGARPWAAHSRFAYAAMLVARDEPKDRSRALELLGVVRRACDEVGLPVLARRADRIMAGLGEPPAPSSPVARLTRREREVAALVAGGLSNRQIAEQLFVSERTAETHVQNILTKLGFGTRTEIAAWAVREGLDRAPT